MFEIPSCSSTKHEMLPWAHTVGQYVLYRCPYCGVEQRRLESWENFRQFDYMRRRGTMKGFA